MTSPLSAEQTLAHLSARQDIQDVLVRYCRAADRCDAAMMKTCFHEDAWDDHGFFSGPASEFADEAVKSLSERFTSTKHFMTNMSVDIADSEARSETYVLAVCRMSSEEGRSDLTLSARYLDRFERRGGLWKIAHRLFVSDGTRIDRIQAEDPFFDRGAVGERGAGDPAHDFFHLNAALPDDSITDSRKR